MPQCGLLEKAPFRAKRCSYTCSATYCGWPWRSYIPLSEYFQKPPSSLLESSGSLSFHKCRGRAGSKVGHTCGSGSWDLSAVPDSLVVSTFCSGSFLRLLHTHITWYSREVGNLSTGWVFLSDLTALPLGGPVTWEWGSLRERKVGMDITTNCSFSSRSQFSLL